MPARSPAAAPDGKPVFAMIARHFMSHEEVIDWLTRDCDFSEEQAAVMLKQVEGRDYNPPRRDRILEWQKEQEFPIIPNPEDPDLRQPLPQSQVPGLHLSPH